ncbi:MAG TPA: alpha-glucuronidase family glycosyl hydrolase [Caulobacterales bacterium]|nr:alpha-glucuronidase family glycosyl hydrolase [Caulobacterales bacterium]
MRLGLLALLLVVVSAPFARAEDGYELWLRYPQIEASNLARGRAAATQIVAPATPSPTLVIARDELTRGLGGMLGRAPDAVASATRAGAVVIGTPTNTPAIAALNLDLSALGAEGYLIRSVTLERRAVTVITANSDVGVLYGAYAYLRLVQTRQPLDHLDIASAPRIALRTLDHWDNLDGTIERGYAGHSIWDWHKLPDYLDPRYTDYARADASIGINAVCLTNVAANATSLTHEYLLKAKALADLFRPYGIRIFLTARFSAPIEIGGLRTADPLDPQVRAWWRAKADEIYSIIPDFGGFLVKANSEGQPGPQDYHGPIPAGAPTTGANPNPRNYQRTHADGANMMAEALAPHGGVVMWRAFVYSAENTRDRAMQAYDDFVPLDGKFLPNVIVQVKNGPIDFQPREPIHPIFGAMPHTAVALEVQITKEYLGQATNLAYLAPMWREAMDTDTYAQGEGSTVARVTDGSLFHNRLSAIAGVSNVGDNRNWTGGVMEQANWYAYGRLAWDHELTSEQIAEEWTRMTFTNDERFVRPVVAMLMQSREAVVDYMTPLGLAHQMATGHHYGPGPWIHDLARPEWNPVYYNHADASGIGFDRTHTGSDAVSQYSPRLAAEYENIDTTPEKFLLWFHHVPWDYRLKNGQTIWDGLVTHYSHGVDEVRGFRATWAQMQPYVDAERFTQISAFLRMQENDAVWWRDASIAYFQSLSQRPLPAGFAPPAHPLAYYEAIRTRYAPGDPGDTAAPFKGQ